MLEVGIAPRFVVGPVAQEVAEVEAHGLAGMADELMGERQALEALVPDLDVMVGCDDVEMLSKDGDVAVEGVPELRPAVQQQQQRQAAFRALAHVVDPESVELGEVVGEVSGRAHQWPPCR